MLETTSPPTHESIILMANGSQERVHMDFSTQTLILLGPLFHFLCQYPSISHLNPSKPLQKGES